MYQISDYEVNAFLNGESFDSYRHFGSHLERNELGEVVATRFTVYAPHAREVRLIADFNQYEGWKHVLTKIHHQGIFSITIPKNLEWATYKYEIHTSQGEVLYKADPYAKFAEVRPNTASKVYEINHYEWHDQKYHYEKKKSYQEPLLIYEVHIGSWRKAYGAFKKYNELADELIKYVLSHGFTHVEFMPTYEYPLDDSWGYQGTGYFAATSRHGVPKDFMYLIDRLHQAGIGVIMDWVLGHICKDAHGLSFFDGTPLYEFNDQHHRENITWGTNNLDFSKGISRSFMLSALNFWVDYFHVDGFRIDAVSNLIYYLGDQREGVNQDAIAFFRQLSFHLFGKDDRILFMAEDSTDFPLVTHPVSNQGLGFNYKWNMGFMNDTLKYFKTDPIARKEVHHYITFGMMYAYHEQFVLPYSHDEVVHMKGSLINKMPGDYFSKFANWRLLMTLWMTHPGKKLLFMGQEFASFSEWNCHQELDWNLFQFEAHQKANQYFKDLAKIYRTHPALYQYDHDPKGFNWLIVEDKNQSVFAYARHSNDETLIIILNMTPNVHMPYEVGVPFEGTYQELLNSDQDTYYGSNLYNGMTLKTKKGHRNGQNQYIEVTIGPLSGIILKRIK